MDLSPAAFSLLVLISSSCRFYCTPLRTFSPFSVKCVKLLSIKIETKKSDLILISSLHRPPATEITIADPTYYLFIYFVLFIV